MLEVWMQIVIYLAWGFIGGALYVGIMKIWRETEETARRVLIGGASGLVVWLIVWATQPEYLDSPLAYLLALFSAYWGVDFISAMASRYKSE